jgi:DNA polymerase III epsilon subunit-like protein
VWDAPPWRLVYPLIEWWLDHLTVVIYNAQYDLTMIDQCRRAAGLRDALDPAMAQCAMLQYSAFDGARSKYGSLKWHKLDAAAARFGIDPGGHRALADAEVCRRVVLAMAASFEET